MRRNKKIRVLLLLVLVFAACVSGCGKKQKTVVVYTAVDQVYADAIFARFEEKTGIKVEAVYDSEANKTTGLVNRLIAEKTNPVCDVFWNNEFIQTIALEKEGILSSYVSAQAASIPEAYKAADGTWTAFGGRARVLLVNTDLVSEENYPTGFYDFVNGNFAGDELAIAYPMFGTTRTMAAAMYAALGEEEARRCFETMAANGVHVVDGNSVTKDMAAGGEVAVAYTDSDDAGEAIEDGAPVVMIYPDQEEGGLGTLITPSTVAMIKGCSHEEAAKAFIDFLLDPETEAELMKLGFFDVSLRGENSIRGMQQNLEEIYNCLDIASADMERIFSTAN